MTIPYRPHIIRNERGVYLITCKADEAREFVGFLNHEGVLANLTTAELTENGKLESEQTEYTALQVDLASPIEHGKAKFLIDKWCATRPD